jgi:nicotinamidase-related amidase
MPVFNDWAAAAERAGVPIFVSRDWHPPRTTHFAEFGGICHRTASRDAWGVTPGAPGAGRCGRRLEGDG